MTGALITSSLLLRLEPLVNSQKYEDIGKELVHFITLGYEMLQSLSTIDLLTDSEAHNQRNVAT